MVGLVIPALLVLAVIVAVVIIVIQRASKKGEEKGSGADIVAYLVLALAMGVTGFALSELANTAFPGDRFIFDPADNIATSLAALVVAAPFALFFWRRQSERRRTYPSSAGWPLYLTVIELVFGIAFVVAATLLIDALLTGEGLQGWPSTVVFGGVLVLHELAMRRTPPLSDAAELPRVVGAAIGLVTTAIGLTGTFTAGFSSLFGVLDVEFAPWLAMLIVGAPIWLYRWLPSWAREATIPRLVWVVVVCIGSFATLLGAATSVAVLILQYLVGDTPPAAQHFENTPWLLGITLTMLAVWFVHRPHLGRERNNALRSYEYALAGIGLASAVIGAIGLTVIAFDRSLIVGGGIDDIIGVAATLVAGGALWLVFSRRHERGDPGEEAAAWPRRLYTLGLGVVSGLISAGALIASLFILLRRIMNNEGGSDSLLIPITVFVYTGLSTWYLLAAFLKDRETTRSDEVITPFEVVIVCSRPGMIATLFPESARLRVIHRGDDAGVIDEAMAEEIVAAVGHQPSLVWVDGDGFRVAPKLEAH